MVISCELCSDTHYLHGVHPFSGESWGDLDGEPCAACTPTELWFERWLAFGAKKGRIAKADAALTRYVESHLEPSAGQARTTKPRPKPGLRTLRRA